VVVSELGDIRREIVLLGDVMNTAARIVDLARDRSQPYLVSDAVMTRAALPEGLEARSIGRVAIRGKAGDIELFAVARAAAAAEAATLPTFTGARAI
jgi:adenylate cyclase